MGVLGAIAYDPATAASASTASYVAMTALDTTNLRITFNAPANGKVLVRLGCQTHGASSAPAIILLGVLESSTVKGRMAPTGAFLGQLATSIWRKEAAFLVTGLTPAASYTWDAAYGVELTVASTAIKWGGPDNTTGDDAFGAFNFEIWETENLLAGTLYDPATAVTASTTSLLAMTAFDTTNLRLTFDAPASGKVMWRVRTVHHGNATFPATLLGVMEGSSVVARCAPLSGLLGVGTATQAPNVEGTGIISGLTPGSSHTYDAAYSVETVSGGGGFKYGGPNNTTTNDAWGGFAFELWEA